MEAEAWEHLPHSQGFSRVSIRSSHGVGGTQQVTYSSLPPFFYSSGMESLSQQSSMFHVILVSLLWAHLQLYQGRLSGAGPVGQGYGDEVCSAPG